jgi:hypothetical protein
MTTHTTGPRRENQYRTDAAVPMTDPFDGYVEFDWNTDNNAPIRLELNPVRDASESEILRALELLDTLG